MNNLQRIVKDNTRLTMHFAVELCEQGDFDSISEAIKWLNQEAVDNHTRWHKLFGTPEKAARTMAGKCSDCCECVIADYCKYGIDEGCLLSHADDYDELLKWLKDYT